MNLVTTGNATISVLTFIVGLLLLAPRTSLMESVRYLVMMRRTPVEERSGSATPEARQDGPGEFRVIAGRCNNHYTSSRTTFDVDRLGTPEVTLPCRSHKRRRFER